MYSERGREIAREICTVGKLLRDIMMVDVDIQMKQSEGRSLSNPDTVPVLYLFEVQLTFWRRSAGSSCRQLLLVLDIDRKGYDLVTVKEEWLSAVSTVRLTVCVHCAQLFARCFRC